MNKLLSILVKIKNYDKYAHLIIGTIVTVLAGQFGTLFGEAAALLAARWKEVYDKAHPDKHTSDGWDAFATAVGIIPGRIILMYQTQILTYIDSYLSLIIA